MLVDPKRAWEAQKSISALQKERAQQGVDTTVTVEDILSMPEISLPDVFEGWNVYDDLKKGQKASEGALEEAFGTLDERAIAARILLEGEIQLTQEIRDELVTKKLNKIVDILARNCVNPQTSLPHPPNRIQKAIEAAKVKIDPQKSAEEQAKDVLKAIQTIIPIRMESIEVALRIPASFAAKGYNLVARYAQITKEEWQKDGSWIAVVDLPSGQQAEFLDRINKLTHGRIETKVLKKSS
ncbi:MAG TPA: ribosome assembly factor SBDS [Candidatus Lokiarchaeia archaeon]|nr:ribosome assembly factor SBDS [Candidatus Lokiarchaeia archaeon]